ncbi:MAG: hypothetical protein PHV34_00160 [Verrucomicrobiae bacterium]|nr:hypothetical protein [Verrucomicrobiae bacterium]
MKDRNQIPFRLALAVWIAATIIRLVYSPGYSGLSFDDTAYATSGQHLLLYHHGYWGDTLRPLAVWWCAFFHWLNGIDIRNLGLAFAALRSVGELFLILASRRFFPQYPAIPLMTAILSAASFLGNLYGDQHLSSLLFAIPFSLYFYSRWAAAGGWGNWLACAFGSGLVFLGHYNTVHALAFMLAAEMFRLIFLKREKLPTALAAGFSGILVCLATIMVIGKFSYGFANWITYFKRIWIQISENQTHHGMKASLSDGFLLSLASWEGLGFFICMAGLAWLLLRIWREPRESPFFCLPLVPLAAGGLVFLRVSLNFLSFPRLYALTLPFLWLCGGALLACIVEKLLAQKNESRRLIPLALAAMCGVIFCAAHQGQIARFASGNVALETYIKARPAKKFVMFNGNPHLAAYLFNWQWTGLNETRQQAAGAYKSLGAEKFDAQQPPGLRGLDAWPYLQHPQLYSVCDLIIFEGCNANDLMKYDAMIRTACPSIAVTNLYHGPRQYLPLQADEGGALSQPPRFNENNHLPIMRIYDLRGAPAKQAAP